MRMIDADDLLMLIDDHDNMVLEDVKSSCLKDVYKMAHVHIKDLIGMMPTVERKTGKWEEIEVIADAYDISGVKTWASKMKCDQCGFTTIAIEGRFSQYNFCPNCGADMRGDDHETN